MSMARPRAQVSHDRCVGVAMCLQVAPAAFKLNAEGLSEFRPDAEADEDLLHEAADACPMSAITVIVDE